MLKGIWNLIPTIIGTTQSLLPLIKELAVVVVRILDVLPFDIKAEEVIIKINEIYDIVHSVIEKAKNALLLIG